jgi:hypothetical protein
MGLAWDGSILFMHRRNKKEGLAALFSLAGVPAYLAS